ncbi:MAG: hypothetical protein RL266_1304, partial [Bacteroidota bacterium]
ACGDVQTTDIVVNSSVDPTITAAGPFCESDNSVNLVAATAGGAWSGTGITDGILGTFDPATAGTGTWTITYTIPGSCGANDTETVVVQANADGSISPTGPFCSSDPPVNLSAVDAGGTWTGTGITNAAAGTFDPAVAGPGTWTITYFIAGACGDMQTTDIEVSEATFSQTVTNIDCYGNTSGEILFQNTTGAAPFLYSIDGGTNFQSNAQFTGLGAANYSLLVEDDNGCQSSVTLVNLTEPNALTAVGVMDQQSSCGNADGQASVTANGGTVAGVYQYSWNSAPPQYTSIATGLSPGNYTVTVIDDNNCSVTETVSVTSTQGFTASISSASDATCFGSCDGQASAVPDNMAVTPVSYQWNDPAGQTTSTATNLCAGNYTVTITDAVGCLATASATISEPAQLVAQVNPTASTVCIGESTTLTTAISGGIPPFNGYSWTATPADPTLVSNSQNPIVSPIVTTTYTLTATDANGCASSQVVVTITVSSPLSLNVTIPSAIDTGICLGESTTINLTASGGDGNYVFYQQPDLVNPINLPVSVQPNVTTTYTYSVADGCSTPTATASSTVTVYPVPSVDFEVDAASGCQPHGVIFTDLTSPTPTSWNWDFGDPNSANNISTVQNPGHNYTEVGTYDVQLSVVSAQGCESSISYLDLIQVFEVPSADFEVDTHRTNILNPTFHFTDLSSSNVSEWNWDFGDGSFSTDQNPSATYLDTGIFFVQLTVTTAEGCVASATDRIYIGKILTFYVPNSFTPDRDRINDGFRAYGEGYDWNTYQMTIYNRWGEEIFRTNDIEEEWKGRFKDEKVEVGVYAWRVHVSDFNGRIYPFSGYVTLIR